VAAWQAVVATLAERRARADRDAARIAQRDEAGARAQANEARTQAEPALDESRRKTARMTYERAQTLCEQGEADLGLLWMARSLELTPESAPDLDRAIRTSINLWALQLNTQATRRSGTNEWARGQELLDVFVSPDGRSVLALGHTYPQPIAGPHLYDFDTGTLRLNFPLEAGAPASGPWHQCRAVFSPNGRYVASCRGDTRARVWNAATGQLIAKPIEHGEPVRGVSIDPTEQILAAAAGSTLIQPRRPAGSRVVQ
jgi:hypothetical protein